MSATRSLSCWRALVIGMCLGGALPSGAAARQATRPADLARDLPSGGSVFALLETTEPEVVTDRFNNGGLNAGEASLLAGFFSSWSQTRYDIAGVEVSSAVDGTPLIFPRILWWESVRVTAAQMPVSNPAAGLSVSLAPRRSTGTWAGEFEGWTTAHASGAAAGAPPPIVSLDRWRSASGVVAGPLGARAGIAAGAAWSHNAVRHRGAASRSSRLATAFASAHLRARRAGELALLAIAEGGTAGNATHLQGSWTHAPAGPRRLRVWGGYTRGRRVPRQEVTDRVERLLHGTVPGVVADVPRRELQWSLGGDVDRRAGRHMLSAGAFITRAAVTEGPHDARVLTETLDGVAAREWVYGPTSRASHRHAITTAAYVSDRITIGDRLEFGVGLRYEHVSGRARGTEAGIAWHAALPGVQVTWTLGTPAGLSLVTGGRRTANRLLLGLLTVGDPASPAGDVYRAAPDGTRGPRVARVGPGMGADPAFSRIAPDIGPSYVDEFAIGLIAQPGPRLRLAVGGVARRQSPLVQLVNTQAGEEAYRMFTIPDANADLVKPDDDQALSVYERLPAAFGRDQYVLTARADEAIMGAIAVTGEYSSPRLFVAVGATAAAAVGPGGNRGFRARENDQDVLGEIGTNPNVATYARGRLFTDRAYTVKWTTVYRFPGEVRLGVIARYQDGQPFTRIVIVPDLQQGADFVQAFARGRSRFSFTGTLDVRIQKRITLGATRLDLLLDVYNVPGMRKTTEEYVVTGARFREPIAVQPPRSVHAGMRVGF